MSEMESDSSQALVTSGNLSFYDKFIGGDFGLAKTYWLLGVLPSFL